MEVKRFQIENGCIEGVRWRLHIAVYPNGTFKNKGFFTQEEHYRGTIEKQKESYNRHRIKRRRSLGFIPLNNPFPGSEGHHFDRYFVIYMPKEKHRSIYHSITKNTNMDKINDLAIDYIFKDTKITIADLN